MTGSLGEVLKEALARKWAEDDAAHKQMEEAKPTGKQLFPITSNVSRATFAYIKANPGRRVNIVDALTAQGFKASSVSSLIAQMLRNGMVVVDAAGSYRVTQPEYTPIKTIKPNKQAKNVIVTKRPVSLPPAAGIAAIAPPPVPTPAPVVVTNEVEHILNTLPIKQARALYDELHKIFGASK